MSLDEWLAKAGRELTAARRALSEGDPETAAARLYYAMFHAAIAALNHEGENITVKSSHGAVIGQFGLHLCKKGLISEDLGRAFNKAYELRCESDYSSGPPDAEKVAEYVDHADQLLAAVRKLVAPSTP